MKPKIKKTIAKYKIEYLVVNDPMIFYKSHVQYVEVYRYTVSYKKHWWQRWQYILNPETNGSKFFIGLHNAIKVLKTL